jgi:hypothetical protein
VGHNKKHVNYPCLQNDFFNAFNSPCTNTICHFYNSKHGLVCTLPVKGQGNHTVSRLGELKDLYTTCRLCSASEDSTSEFVGLEFIFYQTSFTISLYLCE